MKLLISKADLPDYVKFTLNTPDKDINPDIRDAHEFDVLPLLTPAELTALYAYKALPVQDVTDYLALPEADQLLSSLHKPHLFYLAVRGLLCHESYRRFLLMAGLHQTPNGLEVISDTGHNPISTQQRSELRGDAQAKCAIYRGRLLTAQRAFSGAPAPNCHSSTRRPGNGGLTTYAV